VDYGEFYQFLNLDTIKSRTLSPITDATPTTGAQADKRRRLSTFTENLLKIVIPQVTATPNSTNTEFAVTGTVGV